jgi:polysaccharide biosynthesis/export protein
MRNVLTRAGYVVLFAGIIGGGFATAQPQDPARAHNNGRDAAVALPPGYTIGVEDVLSIVFWRDENLSADVTVRPDGMISLPLLNDVEAAGHTPEALREQLERLAARFIAEPNAAVIVKEINSRKLFITGNVANPGMYPLTSDMTVLQFIAAAGGLLEYANARNIGILRLENGKERRLRFNYRDVSQGRNVEQNIQLKPGDTVVVP